MHEFELIKKYFSKLTKNNKYALSLNDDVFFDNKKELVVSVDNYIEGSHFLNFKKPDLVIKKILRSSISDLVCKGVTPKFYFISGSGNKKSFSKKNLLKISKSLKQEQKKYGISLCGGDTTFSNKLSFSITSIGYAKKIIYRNKVKVNDDIYVTGNLGDSYIGLQVLKNRIKIDHKASKYFINKYYQPIIQINLTKNLFKFANSSIDVSDGLIADLKKMTNKQKLSYQIDIDKVPISKMLEKVIGDKKIAKSDLISNGDDYQVLFTSSPIKSRIILNTSKNLGIKITKVGKINPVSKKCIIIDQKGKQIVIKNHGYIHQF